MPDSTRIRRFARGEPVMVRLFTGWKPATFVSESGHWRTVLVDGKRRTVDYASVRTAEKEEHP